jgi:hypothetical protein
MVIKLAKTNTEQKKGETEWLIACNPDFFVSMIVITGDIARHVCEIAINGGWMCIK